MTRDAENALRLKSLGIDTGREAVIYMRPDCPVCRSEGFGVHARVEVRAGTAAIIATVNVIESDILAPHEAGLSTTAGEMLGAAEGTIITVRHAPPIESLSAVRSKIYGHPLSERSLKAIVADISAGLYADVHLSAFVTACAGANLNRDEMVALTRAMIDSGERLDWGKRPIVDKHCVGGLPGNRTTPVIVAIAAAAGLTMPKTSSRAITSPAGTADAMETLAPVALTPEEIRRVVETEGGCIVWGGAVRLSPADDTLIRVERALDLDSEGQLVASVLSKKAAAGATHVVLDLPTGPTAKIRSPEAAKSIGAHLRAVAEAVGLEARTLTSDGRQPIGRGIGPALEARDVLAVLQGAAEAPADLRTKAVTLAAALLELAGACRNGAGQEMALTILEDGRAWKKFQAICEAQGGMRTPPVADHRQDVVAPRPGRVAAVDNRLLARAAKLAGAPSAPAAGVVFHTPLESLVDAGDPLFTIHAETPGELAYASEFVTTHPDIVRVGEA